MTRAPEVATLHLWGVSSRDVPGALRRMLAHRRLLRAGPSGPRFAKLLGTGAGRTFTLRDADPHHWGLIATWDRPSDAEEFERGPVARSWARIASETLRVELVPLSCRGTWSGRTPFTPGDHALAGHRVAALTRARLVPRRAATFWRAVPAVAGDLRRCPGLDLALGVGEAPVGLQGTFSLWESAQALDDFAYGRAAHVEAIRRTAQVGWYSEELFARFAVRSVAGTYQGRQP